MPRTEEPIPFGPLLRQYRIAAGLTQETLAERTGLGVRSIQHLEGGAHLPHRETVGRLIKGLGLTGAERSAFEAASQPTPRERVGSSLPVGEAHDDRAKPRHNLPAQLTSFVGRERELAEVQRLLGSTRLLTITGAGGPARPGWRCRSRQSCSARIPTGSGSSISHRLAIPRWSPRLSPAPRTYRSSPISRS
jgi:transcriptional regulator with XRE-family HTH domain